MKAFLQEGLRTYTPALAALSEFRRQVLSKLQNVLDEFSTQLAGCGLSIDNLKPKSMQLDDQGLAARAQSIELERNYGGELYTNYHVIWALDEPKDKQVRVGAWIWLGIRADRNRLFGALQKQQSLLKRADLVQDDNGLARLVLYCDSDLFYNVDGEFRILIEEWVGLLSGIGGVRPFLSSAASRTDAPPERVLEVGCEGG